MKLKRVLIFIVAYNAERHLLSVIERIPNELFSSTRYQTEILIIDDCSNDRTFALGAALQRKETVLPLSILTNPNNLGYGGNQKVGYQYAVSNGFDFVVLLHGDGQYAPENLPELLSPLLKDEADAVFGSRMMEPNTALLGGMPLYKYIGNKILTTLQNWIIGTNLSEYHSGYRLYSCSALASVPFECNSNGFDFDTDIIIQLHFAGLRIMELPIPTHYGEEVCHVNSLDYALKIIISSIQSRCQRLGIFYNPKFDVQIENTQYESKFDFISSHSLGLAAADSQKSLLILGSGPEGLVSPFIDGEVSVTVVDQFVSEKLRKICSNSLQLDLDDLEFQTSFNDQKFDTVIALDIIEHLRSPESLLKKIRESNATAGAKLIISVPNVAFLPIRIMLLFGFFNYGKRGILDKTHTRLFTFGSLHTLVNQAGFSIEEIKGIPAAFPLALGKNSYLAKLLLRLNTALIRIHRGMFSYQIFCVCRSLPTAKQLLERTLLNSEEHHRNIMDNS